MIKFAQQVDVNMDSKPGPDDRILWCNRWEISTARGLTA